ncbi:MAG: GGDEF domain-containing protein [Burkholderiaceae bacterium]
MRLFTIAQLNEIEPVTYIDSTTINLLMLALALAILGASLGFFLMAYDRLRHELLEQARRDGLTGLLSRTAFLQSSAATGTDGLNDRHAIVMVDLDHFKRINDTFGHAAGDAVLREVARRLLAATREDDLVGRYGGEEFCLMLRNCSREQAAQLSQRIIESVSASPVRLPGGEMLTLTASAGVARQCSLVSTEAPGTDWVEHMLDLADRALYVAKAGGRNRVELASLA